MEVATVQGWEERFVQLWGRVGACFPRCDLRNRANRYVRGLLALVKRKNSWQLAEQLGDATPHGLQRLLGRARWDADHLRDVMRQYVLQHMLYEGERGVLVIDETGFLKKGKKSVGVQRQYSGTAGRIENCQVGVFLALSGSLGRALIDRELYLPKSWCEDEDRRHEAGVPSSVHFATKPELARMMIVRALKAGLQPEWVLGDAVYGSDLRTRRLLESHGQPYVLAVTSQQRLWVGLEHQRVDYIAEESLAENWFRMSIAEGAKGPRIYDWAAVRFGAPTEKGLERWLLVRRHVEAPSERAYYLCAASPFASARDLAVAAGQRWSIETCFETAKQEVGLADYEVRSWTGWYRHITLSMLALVFLAVLRAGVNESAQQKRGLI